MKTILYLKIVKGEIKKSMLYKDIKKKDNEFVLDYYKKVRDYIIEVEHIKTKVDVTISDNIQKLVHFPSQTTHLIIVLNI